jgi:hypothetical protein
MTGLKELKRILQFTPELEERIVNLEKFINQNVVNKATRKWPATFWRTGTIPARFCSIRGLNKEGKECAVPSAADVFAYVKTRTYEELPESANRQCMSVYNLCE